MSGGTIKIGFVSPITGPAAGFGEPDAYVLALAKKAFAAGIEVGGKKYDVEIIAKDGQSNPQRSAQVAQRPDQQLEGRPDAHDLDPGDRQPGLRRVRGSGRAVHLDGRAVGGLVLRSRRQADGEEGVQVRRITSASASQQFASAYTTMWPQVPTNKKVGVMWPNDADGNAIRAALGPLLKKAGYTIVDPGAYTDGTNDYTAQIAKFKKEDCQIFNTFPIPPDFATFWQQAAQQGYEPKIAQIAKTGLFPSQVEALGSIGHNLAGGAYWTPTFPYKSSLTGLSSQELGDGYTTATGKQWNQQIGASMALFDAGNAALQGGHRTPRTRPRSPTPSARCRSRLRSATSQWGKGPFGNVVATPILGGQWIKATSGKFKLAFVICENSSDKNVPVAAKLQPYPA